MHPGEVVFISEFFFWFGLAPVAISLTIWASLRSSKRRAVSIIALCLWCVLGGGTLMGAMWSWMATENQQRQLRKIARLPEGAKPADVNLGPMPAVEFFVRFDRLGRRLGYLTVLVPLLLTALIVRKALSESPTEKRKPYNPEDELFTPYGP